MNTCKPSEKSRSRFVLFFRAFAIALAAASRMYGAQGISSQEFDRLPDVEKNTLLHAAVENWLKRTRNVEYVAETQKLTFATIPPGFSVEGDTTKLSRFWHRVRILGDSHWIHQRVWVEGSREDEPVSDSVILFDSQGGSGKSLATHSAMNGKYGRITTVHLPECEHNEYGTNYDMGCTCSSNVPLLHLLENQADWRFLSSTTDSLVHVQLPDRHCEMKSKSTGLRDMWFDPGKDFLLVREKRQVHAIPDGDRWKVYWEVRYQVTDSVQCDGLWFPARSVRIRIFDGDSSARVVRLEKISMGQISPAQLALEFPNGTEVMDEIHDAM